MGFTAENLSLMRGLLFPQWRVFEFVVGVTVQVTTDASGNWGSAANGLTVSVANFSTAVEWASLAALFDDVFALTMTHRYMPYNRYAPQNVGLSGPGRYSVGVAMSAMHHGSAVYTSHHAMQSNPSVRNHLSGDPFQFTWKNIEKMDPKGPTFSVSGTSSVTQTWCSTNATSVAGYQGFTQMIGWDTITGNPSSSVGRIATVYKLAFRNRA